MSSREEDQILEQWCATLVDALEMPGLAVDITSVLGLAGRAAHSVLRPAAPLTTYVVGYAAGLAAAKGQVTGADAARAATDVALQLCRNEPSHEEPAGAGKPGPRE